MWQHDLLLFDTSPSPPDQPIRIVPYPQARSWHIPKSRHKCNIKVLPLSHYPDLCKYWVVCVHCSLCCCQASIPHQIPY